MASQKQQRQRAAENRKIVCDSVAAGLTTDEIADETGLPLATISFHCRRAGLSVVPSARLVHKSSARRAREKKIVLEEIARGRTMDEICERTGLSMPTVRAHQSARPCGRTRKSDLLPPATIIIRDCLGCRRKFKALGRYNRLCSACGAYDSDFDDSIDDAGLIREPGPGERACDHCSRPFRTYGTAFGLCPPCRDAHDSRSRRRLAAHAGCAKQAAWGMVP